MKYNLPGPPTALARRRRGDLKQQQRRLRRQLRRQDRRRTAFHIMKQRLKIAKEYHARRRTADRCGGSYGEAADHTAERFGVSARSVRRYFRLFCEGGKRALLPNYRQAQHPRTKLPPHVVQIALLLRHTLRWCGQRIAHELAVREIAQTSHTAIYRLFRRYRVPVRTYHRVGKCDGIRYRRQRVKAPNWTWHIDFAGPWHDDDGTKHSIMVVIDSYSRFLLALEVTRRQTSEVVETVLSRLFERYGRPQVIITDNGPAFMPSKPEWAHRFVQFLEDEGVEHRPTAHYYPQTNGKAEAAIKTVKREFVACLPHAGAIDWSEAAHEAVLFQGWYNFYRSHGAIGYDPPSVRYAGVRVERNGLERIYGLGSVLPASRRQRADVPDVSGANRTARLSLLKAA